MKGQLGYGRYPDGHVGCPRATSDMTPCVARDGVAAEGECGECIGCGRRAADLLVEAVQVLSVQVPSRIPEEIEL